MTAQQLRTLQERGGEFLFDEFYSINDNNNEIMKEDLNFITGNKYKNIFELRFLKNYYLIKNMPNKIKVMRVIARMNIGGPAVQVMELMNGIDKQFFDQRLYTGYCDKNEAEFLDVFPNNITINRIWKCNIARKGSIPNRFTIYK